MHTLPDKYDKFMDENWVEIVSKEKRPQKPVLKKKSRKGDSMLDITLNQKEEKTGKDKDALNMTFDLGGLRGRSSTMKPSGRLFATVDPGIVRFEEQKKEE